MYNRPSPSTAGQRPADLSKEEGIAYDVAACLSNGGQLHDTTYRAAPTPSAKTAPPNSST